MQHTHQTLLLKVIVLPPGKLLENRFEYHLLSAFYSPRKNYRSRNPENTALTALPGLLSYHEENLLSEKLLPKIWRKHAIVGRYLPFPHKIPSGTLIQPLPRTHKYIPRTNRCCTFFWKDPSPYYEKKHLPFSGLSGNDLRSSGSYEGWD